MNQLASRTLKELAQSLRRYTDRAVGRDTFPTAIQGLSILRSDQANRPANCLFHPALYLTLQGAKWGSFGNKRYKFAAGQALMVAVDIPSRGTVVLASAEAPYLGIQIALDFSIMQEMVEELDMSPLTSRKARARGAFVLDLNPQLLDCTQRAINLLEIPEAIPRLYPGIMREVCYWLLTGPEGSQISEIMMMANGQNQKIVQAIHTLRDKLRETVQVEGLAVAANMSQATFHRQFKSITGITPLAYQKQLRLHEARRVLIFRGATVESAARDVGYASVSQFSREYSRMFGRSPRRDAQSWKSTPAAAVHE
ncbi:AraC family transcriptional regulator N-terminal domain-containing protein [Terriglobus sp. 2YAB30_2]|uniref:AraC family transcriptional regulator n=2 Tax=unclassified Terriglobus TaxID=2628988 RepID=UPI003F947E05